MDLETECTVSVAETVKSVCQSRNTLMVLKIFGSSKKYKHKRLEFDGENQMQNLQTSNEHN
jgi:hypothetical protein